MLRLLNMGGRRTPGKLEESYCNTDLQKRRCRNCGNYRGISLLKSGYKVYANIIKNRLSRYYDNILGKEKTGFVRVGHVVMDTLQ
jgi:hypothetical protein